MRKKATIKQKAYIIEYNKENLRRVNLALNEKTDKDIIDFLFAMKNKNGYLKELIRKDMNSRLVD